jgi:hypothetical protein
MKKSLMVLGLTLMILPIAGRVEAETPAAYTIRFITAVSIDMQPKLPKPPLENGTSQIGSNDGWDRPLWVIVGDYAMVFVSLGADGKIGTADDISGGLKWNGNKWVLSGCAEGG